jgi:hypothetical protein
MKRRKIIIVSDDKQRLDSMKDLLYGFELFLCLHSVPDAYIDENFRYAMAILDLPNWRSEASKLENICGGKILPISPPYTTEFQQEAQTQGYLLIQPKNLFDYLNGINQAEIKSRVT